jgi:hypothetical protein
MYLALFYRLDRAAILMYRQNVLALSWEKNV